MISNATEDVVRYEYRYSFSFVVSSPGCGHGSTGEMPGMRLVNGSGLFSHIGLGSLNGGVGVGISFFPSDIHFSFGIQKDLGGNS